jgi:predicted metal-dependent enzyme (double-stranded beta helix superfamily)
VLLGIPKAAWVSGDFRRRDQESSPRLCAEEIHATLDANGGSMVGAEQDVLRSLERLARQPDLLAVTLPRSSAHGLDGGWLYWDGEINILHARFPEGVEVPVHDHGTWEIVGVYAGELEYRGYKRLDDGSRPGHADLELTDERVLRAGEFSVVPPPPDDVHGFRPRNGEMTLIGVIHGQYGEERNYFDVESGSCVRQSQFAWKRDLGR